MTFAHFRKITNFNAINGQETKLGPYREIGTLIIPQKGNVALNFESPKR